MVKEFKGMSLSDFIRDWSVFLSSLSTITTRTTFTGGSSKVSSMLNFDGASKGKPGLTGFGCVFSDAEGNIIRVTVGPIDSSDSTKVEVFGMLTGSFWDVDGP